MLLVVVAVVALMLVLGGDDESDSGGPREVSTDALRDFARDREQRVYWAGPADGAKLELTETSRGHVFLRYLPKLAPVGDDKPLYTAVGTYPRPNALASVREAGKGRGMITRKVRGGGLAVWSRQRPTSVYLAFPGADEVIEVFDPDGREARDLATSGRIEPVS